MIENQIIIDQPKNQTTEVLYELLTRGTITRAQIFRETGILNLTARIADLRAHGLTIECAERPARNKHGRAVTFGEWRLADGSQEMAVKLYGRLNKNTGESRV